MAEEFEVKPDELRVVAARLGELGSEVGGVVSRIRQLLVWLRV